MIKAVFFDLDGTLVPCDTNEFVKGYFKLLVNYLKDKDCKVPLDKVGPCILKAVNDVLKNDGGLTNKEVFWQSFFALFSMSDDDKINFKTLCDHFYEYEFDEAKNLLEDRDPKIDEVLAYIKKRDLIKVLATSPVFPRAATNKRVNWIGHEFEEFDHITTYDNCIYCKPDLRYYRGLLAMFALRPEEVIMVGNDVLEDMRPALTLGMKTFFIDRFALHTEEKYSGPKGDFKDFLDYLKTLCE